MDLKGKYVMPGIINLHGHVGNVIGLGAGPEEFHRANYGTQPEALRFVRCHHASSAWAANRICRSKSGRSNARAGRHTHACITAGRGFTGKGGYPTSAPGMKGVPFEVETPEQVKKDVAWLADKKVDLVKIWVDDHFGKERKIPMDLSKAIIDEAHKHQAEGLGAYLLSRGC